MTTRVTIAPPEGHTVMVTLRHGQQGRPAGVSTEWVDGGVTRDIHVHDGLSIIGIEEVASGPA